MRTLGLGMLALLAMTFALLSNGGPVAAEPTDKEKSEMAAKVYTLLKDKCYSCHGEAGKKVMGKKGTLNYILDNDKLISEKLIDTKSPEKSELYTEISEGNMPRELDNDGKAKIKKKLAQADIDLVLNWLKAGAPKWAAPAFTGGLEGHEEAVVAAVFSSDGKYILTGGHDDTARLWDAATGKQIWKLETGEWVSGVAFSPDGKLIYTLAMNQMVTVWEVSSGKEARKFEAKGTRGSGLAISPNGKLLLTAESFGGLVRLWDIETGKEIRTFGTEDPETFGHSAVFSPDGKQVLIAGPGKAAHLWETDTAKEVRKFEGHTEEVSSAVFSPDAKFVLTGSADKTARLWDAATGKEVRKFEGHTQGLRSVAFSSDAKNAVTTGDYTARVWDVATGKELNHLKHHFKEQGMDITAETGCAVFSPDGKRVVSCGLWVRVWETLPNNK